MDQSKVSSRPPSIDIKWKLVTPSLAEKFLSKSDGNRSLRGHHISKMARDARSGAFHTTHHAMAFDDRGVFVDGHHRCEMIKSTGIPQWILVAEGVPHEALTYIDAGMPRNIRDSIQILHLGDPNADIPSTSEIAVAHCFEVLPVVLKYRYSRNEIIQLLNQGAYPIGRACTGAKVTGLTKVVKTLLARAYLWAQGDEDVEEKVEQFHQILKDGHPGDAEEPAAAITYRNYLHRMIGLGRGGHQAEIDRYRKGQSALRAFLNGDNLRQVRATKEDVFPLPSTWNKIYKMSNLDE